MMEQERMFILYGGSDSGNQHGREAFLRTMQTILCGRDKT